MDTSPPSYFPPTADAYSQPHPAFRQRKSATIISICPSISSGSEGSVSPSTSPLKTPRTLSHEQSNVTLRSEAPSYSTEDDLVQSDGTDGPKQAVHDRVRHVRKESLERRESDSSSAAEEGEATPLLAGDDFDPTARRWKGPLFVAGVKLGVLFVVFTGVVVGTFYFGVPKLEAEDKAVMKLPRSFADLQALNHLFQKYKSLYPLRILACGVVSYLFVQTFSLPGSMYISILFGAAYGMFRGLILSCLCDSIGSLFCYTLSSLLAPPLLTLPSYRARVETWRTKIMGPPGKEVSWDGVFAFLIVLRIAPFPPHWVANFVAPHLGIGMFLFWASCFIGIAPVSVIHVTIGSSLDSMTSADDFHILSVRNILGLCAVVVAVLIPVGLKRVFRKDLGELGEAEEVLDETAANTTVVDVPAVQIKGLGVPVDMGDDGRPKRYRAVDSGVRLAGPSAGDPSLDITSVTGAKRDKGKGRAVEIMAHITDEDENDEAALYQPHDSTKPVASKVRQFGNDIKESGKKRLQGYGAIEPQPVLVQGRDVEGPGGWWAFSR